MEKKRICLTITQEELFDLIFSLRDKLRQIEESWVLTLNIGRDYADIRRGSISSLDRKEVEYKRVRKLHTLAEKKLECFRPKKSKFLNATRGRKTAGLSRVSAPAGVTETSEPVVPAHTIPREEARK